MPGCAAGRLHSLGLRLPSSTGAEDPGTGGAPHSSIPQITAVAPNPLNPPATVWFDAGPSAKVSVVVYDVDGRRVRSMGLGEPGPGRQRAEWDGRDATGARMPSGVYSLRLLSDAGQSRPVKAILVR